VRTALLVIALAFGGCAFLWSTIDPVAYADRLATAGDLDGALRAYESALEEGASGGAAIRARAGFATVSAAIAARDELKRVRVELARVTADITARERELARLAKDLNARDGELSRLRTEADQLRANLEDLKRIEMRLERRR
jgi:chromosome segregation ATPase